MLETLKILITDRAAGHWGKFERRDRMTVVFVHAIPDIREVHDWHTSATRRWSKADLDDLQRKSPRRLAAWLMPNHSSAYSDLEAEAVIELVMHGDVMKARDFMNEIIRRRPAARDSFTRRLGGHITKMLLADNNIR